MRVGADSIVLDVKLGSGAFMKTLDDARSLSSKMVNIGKLAKRDTIAIITNMDVPLGENVGNSLEVIEAIDTLKGNGPKDLLEVSIELATAMVMLSKQISQDEARGLVTNVISTGEAFEKFKQVVKAQGGDITWIEDTSKFPEAEFKVEVRAPQSGYICNMNTEEIGKVACILGAGRETKEDVIDYSAGIKILKKTSDFANKDEVLAILYTNKEEKIEEAKQNYIKALEFSENGVEKPKLIYEIIK